MTTPFSAPQQGGGEEGTGGDPATADFNGDGRVDFDDLFLFADFFGSPASGAAVPYDLDASGAVDIDDFFLFTNAFGGYVAQ